MNQTSLHKLLISYLKECKRGNCSTDKVQIELQKQHKTESEIHEILTEFEDEWDKELLQSKIIKGSKMQIIGGLILALIFSVISILMALKIINIGVSILFYGAVATGLLIALKGFQNRRMEKLRIERREIKWRWMEKGK